MKYIVDTHILLWSILDPGKLSENILQTYEQADEVHYDRSNLKQIAALFIRWRRGSPWLKPLKTTNLATQVDPDLISTRRYSCQTLTLSESHVYIKR